MKKQTKKYLTYALVIIGIIILAFLFKQPASIVTSGIDYTTTTLVSEDLNSVTYQVGFKTIDPNNGNYNCDMSHDLYYNPKSMYPFTYDIPYMPQNEGSIGMYIDGLQTDTPIETTNVQVGGLSPATICLDPSLPQPTRAFLVNTTATCVLTHHPYQSVERAIITCHISANATADNPVGNFYGITDGTILVTFPKQGASQIAEETPTQQDNPNPTTSTETTSTQATINNTPDYLVDTISNSNNNILQNSSITENQKVQQIANNIVSSGISGSSLNQVLSKTNLNSTQKDAVINQVESKQNNILLEIIVGVILAVVLVGISLFFVLRKRR